MVSASEFVLYQVQASAFAASADLKPAASLRRVFQSDWSEQYDASPTALHLPPGLPPEIPEVTLINETETRRLEIARGRVNVFWHMGPDEIPAAIDVTLASFAEQIAAVFEGQSVAIGRLAAVVTRYFESTTPGRALADQFFQERWLDTAVNRPAGLEIHAHKVFNLRPRLPVNSWIRMRTGSIDSENYNAITVEQDINSLSTERHSRRFDRKQTLQFFSLVSRELDSVLRLYFPSEGE